MRGLDEREDMNVPNKRLGLVAGAAVAALAIIGGTVGLCRPAGAAEAAYNPTTDSNSMYSVASVISARDASVKVTGKGVDVALLDSGVAPVDGLDAPGQIVQGPDLSFDSQNPDLAHLDTFGHGTHMAGIIAGRDASPSAAGPGGDASNFAGIAPNARIVNVKLADASGATDVSQVIAGIDWAVEHAHDPGFNIRVINLSFGTSSNQSYLLDPLAHAAEVAWRNGIVVVAAAGNGGTAAGRLADPAIDPYVIAVGSDDAKGTRDVWDDVIADYSSRGDGTRNPDVVAPGSHVQSLRVPGSFIDDRFGTGAGSINARFIRGSGTSQAAAVVTGAVALLLEQRPNLTPDQVKLLLTSTARAMPSAGSAAAGAGLINVKRALSTSTPYTRGQRWTPSTGYGDLEPARGSIHLSLNGIGLAGEQDIFGNSYDTHAQADLEEHLAAWNDGTFNGQTWAGQTWAGQTWAGTAWTGQTWADASWTGQSWAGQTWAGQNWAGQSWAGQSWGSAAWAGQSWSVGTWS
jgi:serine protease AprX